MVQNYYSRVGEWSKTDNKAILSPAELNSWWIWAELGEQNFKK